MNVVRRSRLAVGTCPGCSGNTLVSNGSFWRCEICCYAVTSTALTADRAAAEAVVRRSLQGFHERFETPDGVDDADFDAIPAGSRR
ncbi:MAG: hypothetical protein LZF60_260039 [Nitrospira sp.]|nr:hypothetical protein [Nitrospira sp.]ULA60644.1 MAG: hypothetical protein LZF60_260039 [Nitrospira sp.]